MSEQKALTRSALSKKKVVSYAPDWPFSLVMQMMPILTSTMHARYMYIVFLNENVLNFISR